MPAYLLPSFSEALAAGGRHAHLALATAAWMRYLQGSDEAGRPIDVQDARAQRLQRLARAGGTDPRPLLSERAIFGDLGMQPRAVDAIERALVLLDRRGVHGAIERLRGSDLELAA
jgi:fructuronate reductase/mannitol 2-dehydrogenase